MMHLSSKFFKYSSTVTRSRCQFLFLILFGVCIKNSKSENFFISETGKIFREGEIHNETSLLYNKNLPVQSKLLSISSAYDKLKSDADKINLNQFILFNIDDKEVFKSDYLPIRSLYKQPLNQTTVNYCDFDPNLISSKRQAISSKITSNDVKQNVDIIVKGRLFNKSSEISVRIQFQNKQAESLQLWYLLEAKSVCTNKVVGTWRLNKDSNTETIYCFNRDDTVFGHRKNQSSVVFDQIWIPTKTFEDIYFVLAVFTDEAYSTLDPYYSIISSPIILYESYSLIDDYNIKCGISRIFNNYSTNLFTFESTGMKNNLSTESTDTVAATTRNPKDLNDFNQNIKTITSSSTMQSTPPFSLSTTTSIINSITNIYDQDRSILINLVGKIPDCSKLNTNLAIVIQNQLETLYRNVSDFNRVEIVKITSSDCSSSIGKIKKRQTSVLPDVTIEHYCLFKQPVNNRTKMNLLNILQDSVLTSQQIGGLSPSEAFILNNNNRIYLNQSCSVYEYLEICQNSAVCQIDKNSYPVCACPSKLTGESFYWSGEYCDVKVTEQNTSDLIKMYITIGVLATFAIASLVALVLYIIYKRRKQREIIKRVLSEKSKASSSKTLSSPNYIDYPRLNGHTDPHLRTIAYPCDVIISSPPKNQFKNIFRQQPNSKKPKSKSEKQLKKDHLKTPVIILDKEYTSEKTKQQTNSHVNYAYDNEIMFSAPAQTSQIQNVQSDNLSKVQPFFWKGEQSQEELFQQNIHTHSDEFLIESQMHRNNIKLGRKDSAQHIPQSFERNMAKNLKNLTTNSSPSGSYSLDTSIETSINLNSKYTDSTSICTDHSLKDEDAWLPILTIAEEEILKYQAQEAKQTEYCLI